MVLTLFWTVSDRFWTVSDRFRTVSDRLQTVLDRFRTVSDHFLTVFGPFCNDQVGATTEPERTNEKSDENRKIRLSLANFNDQSLLAYLSSLR